MMMNHHLSTYSIFTTFRYPLFTTEEKLQGFRGDIKRGKCKERYLIFIQRVVATESNNSVEDQPSKLVELLNVDCIKEFSSTSIAKIDGFYGSDVVFLDLPKVRTVLHHCSIKFLTGPQELFKNGVAKFFFIPKYPIVHSYV